MRINLRGAAAAAATATLLAGLSGCGPQYDPLTREGLFHPEHSNRTNLVLSVANPADLVRGTGSATSDGQIAAAAVERLRQDKVKRLPAADIAVLGSGANDAGSSGSGAP